MGIRVISVLGLGLGLLVLVAFVAETEAIDCQRARSTIDACTGYLSDPNPTLPDVSCCKAAMSLVDMGDTRSVCDCIDTLSYTYGYLASKARKIPASCNAPGFAPLVPCVSFSTDNDVVVPNSFMPKFRIPPFRLPPFRLPPFRLPPFLRFPPLFPGLPPFIPLPPLLPLPPFEPLPLPPLLPLPPFEPLPLPPLLPLPPFGPLPPVVPLPPVNPPPSAVNN